jgi:hypothetical protein
MMNHPKFGCPRFRRGTTLKLNCENGAACNAMITFGFDRRDIYGRGCETAIRFGREAAS